jgi:hypothetical protein
MIRATIIVAALLVAAGNAPAQATKAAGTKTPATKAPATKAADTKAGVTQASGTKAAGTKTAGTKTAGTKAAANSAAGQGGALSVAQEQPEDRLPDILREEYDYDDGGRRDPFFSLLSTSELRPTIADLKLVGILFDESGRRPVAVLRDVATNEQYRITTGMTLGRMRVSTIRRRSVVFTIEEFGLNRQDSLVLGDTTRARGR